MEDAVNAMEFAQLAQIYNTHVATPVTAFNLRTRERRVRDQTVEA